MVKMNTKKGRELGAAIKQALLTGQFGDLFAPDFNVEDLDWEEIRCSDPDWESNLTQKQVREFCKRVIATAIAENSRADTEAADMGLGARPRRAAAPTDFDTENLNGAMDDLAVDEPEEHHQWPINMQEHKDIDTDDVYVDAFIGPIPQGPCSIRIVGRKVILSVAVDPMRYSTGHYMAAFPHENTQQGGVRRAAFAEEGRRIVGGNEANPSLIVDEGEYTMPFSIEPNFYARLPAAAHYEFTSTWNNRYYHFTVRKVRSNQHRENANGANIGNVNGPPPQQGHFNIPPPFHQPQQHPHFGGGQQQQQQQAFGGGQQQQAFGGGQQPTTFGAGRSPFQAPPSQQQNPAFGGFGQQPQQQQHQTSSFGTTQPQVFTFNNQQQPHMGGHNSGRTKSPPPPVATFQFPGSPGFQAHQSPTPQASNTTQQQQQQQRDPNNFSGGLGRASMPNNSTAPDAAAPVRQSVFATVRNYVAGNGSTSSSTKQPATKYAATNPNSGTSATVSSDSTISF